ncbi:MAG: flippase [Candidatus Promineifilaceae bacterium]
MNQTNQTIAKNASVLLASQLITWVLTLLLTLFLPRYLGAASVGKLHFANSLWAIVTIAVTFGMDQLMVKEIARDPAKTAVTFSTSIVMRAGLYLFGLAAVTAYLRLLDYPSETIQIVYVIGFSQLVGLFIGAAQSALQGLEQMKYMSLATVVAKTIHTTIAISLLLLGYGVLAVAGVTVVTAVINLTIQLIYLRRLQPLRFRFDWRTGLAMLRAGSPYLFTYLFLVMYQQVDAIIISMLVNDTTLGWYSAADKLFGTFLFVPTVFMTAVFPTLSRMHKDEPDALPRLMRQSFNLLLLLSVPIGLGVIAIANPLMVLLFGAEFTQSGPVMAVLGLVLIFTYQNMLLGQFIISIDRQNAWTLVMVIATLATIPLDLALVPWCLKQFGNGAIGGALAFVVTELGMVAAGLILLPKGTLNRSTAWYAARVLLAGLGMAAVAWLLRDQFILLPVVAGTAVYLTSILLLRVVGRQEWRMLQTVGAGMAQKFGKGKAAATAVGD